MEAAALMFAGTSLIFLSVTSVLWVLLVVARWNMFTKADEKGWKSIIPVYSDYTLYKLVWNTKSFWIFVGLSLVSSLLTAVSGQYAMVDGQPVMVGGGNAFINVLLFVTSLGVLFYSVMVAVKTAQAYGKGAGFAVGLFLLPPIFSLILAFGSAEYVGPQE